MNYMNYMNYMNWLGFARIVGPAQTVVDQPHSASAGLDASHPKRPGMGVWHVVVARDNPYWSRRFALVLYKTRG